MKQNLIACLLLFSFCANQKLFAQKDISIINSGEILNAAAKQYDEGKYQEAMDLYELIGRNDTNYTIACKDYAFCAYNLGKYDTVMNLCKILMDRDDYVGIEAYTLYGSSLDEKDKSDDAIKFYNEAIAKFPKAYLLHFNLGVAYYRAGKHDDAYRCFKRTLELNPRHPNTHYFLGLLLADNKRWAPAMLAFNTAMMLDPSPNLSGKCLNYLISVAKAEYTPPFKNDGKLSESEDPNFARIDKLIESKVALNEGYEIAAKIDDKLMKQNQFLLEAMKKTKPVSDNYFVKQYVPLFSELLATQNLKTFEFYPFKAIDNELVNKWKSKSNKDIQEYESWISNYFDKTYADFVDTVNGKAQKFQRFSYSGGTIEALGTDFDAKAKARKGYWRFFYGNSILESEGNYDNNGKMQGEWKSYYGNGKLKAVVTYKDGKRQGRLKEYFMNGNLKRDAPFKDDMYDGRVLVYYNNGALESENDYTSNVNNGKVKTYFQNGNPNLDIDAKNDKINGKIVQYDVHGYVAIVTDAKDGEKDGQYISYYANGRVKAKGILKVGKPEGKWLYYDEDGNKTKECEFVKGDVVGNVKEYYANGKVSTDETYDSKGKLTGLIINYDEDGIKYFEGNYKDDKLLNYKYFDKKGQIIYQGSDNHGDLDFKAYSVYGKLVRAGLLRKGDRQGKWTYYFRNGGIRLTETYENGVLWGPFQEFYKSGVLHKEGTYKNGKLEGHYYTYFENGKLQEEFMLVGGEREGDDYSYYMNGSVSDHSYYTGGEEVGWQSNYYPDGKLNYEYFDDGSLMTKYFVYDTTGKVVSKFMNPQGTTVFDVKFFNGKQKVYGNYKNGRLDGVYKYYYSNGQVDGESNYKKSYRNGPAKEYYMTGKLMKEAFYKNGFADSVWTVYDRDGAKSNSGPYKDDDREGYWRWYYPNGKTEFSGLFKEGDKDSIITMYAPDGTVRVKLKYDQGELLSYTYVGKDGKDMPEIKLENETGNVVAYYPNGQKSYEASYKNGWREGKCLYYYTDGKVQWEENYVHGDMTGKQTFYRPDGKLEKELNEYYDEYDGLCKFYDKAGNLIREENYTIGYLNGPVKDYEGGKLKKQTVYYYGVEL